MPSLLQNRDAWTAYDWDHRGEMWSAAWGRSENIWYGTLLPRLHHVLPAGRVLEIAPGFGRLTQYLLEWCDEFVGIDLTPRCVAHCRARFSGHERARFFVNDGLSLDAVEDHSIDFVFSWDSLVHAERDVLETYLSQLGRKLKPGGSGFIHHSNLGAYQQANGELTVPNPHWRASTMTADLFRELCNAAGLRCVTQELIGWGTETILNDCFSSFRREAATGDPPMMIERPDFHATEAARIKELRTLYARPGSRKPETISIDWKWDAAIIEDIVRTCQRETVPVATLAGEDVRLLDAELGTDPVLLARGDAPGTILKATPHATVVQTGNGTVVLRRVEKLDV